MDGSCHIYERVMSHIWMRHVSHMNESCHQVVTLNGNDRFNRKRAFLLYLNDGWTDEGVRRERECLCACACACACACELVCVRVCNFALS